MFVVPLVLEKIYKKRVLPKINNSFALSLLCKVGLGRRFIHKRIGAKLLWNALSTCTMVRLGRVLGNRMIWVVPSNLKLIDRSTRYIRDLAGVTYDEACYALFDVIEYIEPRRRAGRAYPAPVGVATMRLRHGLMPEAAEARLLAELG